MKAVQIAVTGELHLYEKDYTDLLKNSYLNKKTWPPCGLWRFVKLIKK